MKPRKKNKFFTFVCAFCPGAAEMYMGFLKCGLSLLVAFFIPILVAILYGGDYLSILSGIVYVFSFFHAMNVASTPQDEFEHLEDRYIWEEFTDGKSGMISPTIYRKWVAVALLLVGISGVWYSFRNVFGSIMDCFILTDYEKMLVESILSGVPRVAFSIFVIVIGVTLIRGKKKELIGEDEDGNISGINE